MNAVACEAGVKTTFVINHRGIIVDEVDTVVFSISLQ